MFFSKFLVVSVTRRKARTFNSSSALPVFFSFSRRDADISAKRSLSGNCSCSCLTKSRHWSPWTCYAWKSTILTLLMWRSNKHLLNPITFFWSSFGSFLTNNYLIRREFLFYSLRGGLFHFFEWVKQVMLLFCNNNVVWCNCSNTVVRWSVFCYVNSKIGGTLL